MTRSGYTQIHTAATVRSDDIAVVCALTHRDVGEHSHRVACYDDALRHYRALLQHRHQAVLKLALDAFITSEHFVPAIVKSTQAPPGGEWYAVELFQDGKWRVLWSGQIGNLYESPGAIIRVPALTDERREEGDLGEVAEFYQDVIAGQMRDDLDAQFAG
jgi:hypothetical protein